MEYEYKDYEKLKELERVAYSEHQDYIDGHEKSLDKVITSSKAYRDCLNSLKIKYEAHTKMDTYKNNQEILTPIEQFQKRNKCGIGQVKMIIKTTKQELETYEKNNKGTLSDKYKDNSQNLMNQFQFHLNNLKYSTKLLERYQNNLNILARSADTITKYKNELSKIIPLSSFPIPLKKELPPSSPKEIKKLRIFTIAIFLVIIAGGYLMSKSDVSHDWMKDYHLMKH